jgi:hypothetical protein
MTGHIGANGRKKAGMRGHIGLNSRKKAGMRGHMGLNNRKIGKHERTYEPK